MRGAAAGWLLTALTLTGAWVPSVTAGVTPGVTPGIV
jgi:hypothetical protein